MMNDSLLLRPVWKRLFKQPAWLVCMMCFVGLGVLRAYGVSGSGPSSLLALGFVLMWCLPFLLFSKEGRYASGFKKIDHPIWLLWGILLGCLSSFVIFGIGYVLYGITADNWYVTVRASYQSDLRLLELPRTVQFLVFTIPAVVFSPLGEEFFFRGMLYESIKESRGGNWATAVTALAFGGIHILHHGLYWGATGVHVLAISGLLWVALMAGVSWVFTLCRQKSGAIWPSVLGHAAFNLVMNLTIFYLLP